MENKKIGVGIPETFVNAAHEEMIESFRLNLVDLPEGTVDQRELELIARPFAEHILDKHTPFHSSCTLADLEKIAGTQIVSMSRETARRNVF